MISRTTDVLFMSEMNEWKTKHSNLSILPRLGLPFANFHSREDPVDEFMDVDSLVAGIADKLTEDIFQDFKIEKSREAKRIAHTACQPRNSANIYNATQLIDRKLVQRRFISPTKSSIANDAISKKILQANAYKLRPALSKRTV
ncbi:hypothetical protein TVAG_349010 [Trichomonas vaginalis G3]|uniref:Uncharacterized protein n=1 Tax=Trichomonas vaginalis (strain ATCC PRA-98 / G3) TaxID=412133 RepID=A2G4H3_TRIV3|nr:hypothetical protein TVAGG3_0571400 [Trichomonas vaginalis G3]EAX87939.1 hypothetical protein TVAG_349010 [Trichomonas vaginalis G3]KAI5521932.1 hypothetical protein TVAGG3_0571400 [Trichomonas vaginalis G3]|eukprot:XP_001300869.1 hypothetical protein [Trichomonas vaginalis G3]